MPPSPERPQNNFERERDVVLAVVREKIARQDNTKTLDEIIQEAIDEHSKNMPELQKIKNAQGDLINSGIATAMKNSIKSIITGKPGFFSPKQGTTPSGGPNYTPKQPIEDIRAKRYDLKQEDKED